MSQEKNTPRDNTGTDNRLSQAAVLYPMHIRDGDSILPYGRDTVLWGPQDPLDLIGRKSTYPYIPIPPLIL
jgi:hypothetical protein